MTGHDRTAVIGWEEGEEDSEGRAGREGKERGEQGRATLNTTEGSCRRRERWLWKKKRERTGGSKGKPERAQEGGQS